MPPRLVLAAATALDRYPASALPFALTQLRRGLTQVLAALKDAQEKVSAVLGSETRRAQ